MSRIYLSQHNKNSYWIRDILDGKKLGKIKSKKDKLIYQLHKKHKGKFIETESYLLLNNKISPNFKVVYQNYIQQLCGDWADLNNYEFPLFIEACRLKRCENDMFDRKAWLHPATRKAWKKMKKSAKNDNIDVQIISAYRSLDYQKQLIENKIAKGISIEEILKVNTLPGFSEHHTGCAIDIGSKGEAILETEFDQSPAFKWLLKNANSFGFYMTYPKNNNTGIMYEPWHWCFKRNYQTNKIKNPVFI